MLVRRNAATNLPTNVTLTAVREFRYDGGGRARYLMQDRDPATLDVIPGSAKWSHYQGNSIYGDYTVNATNTGFDDARRYLPGVAQLDPDPADPTILNPEFVHSDQVGSMRALTDDTGAFTREVIYTSFGEPVSTAGASSTRYGYVGVHGYEESLIPGWDFVHVGARWYAPSTGRFLQRDPIGIRGGPNVFSYVDNAPADRIDPLGESWWPNKGIIRYGPSSVRTGYRTSCMRLAFRAGPLLHVYGLRGAAIAGGSVGAAAAAGAGAGMAINATTEVITGKSLSDRIGDGLFKLCPGCWDW